MDLNDKFLDSVKNRGRILIINLEKPIYGKNNIFGVSPVFEGGVHYNSNYSTSLFTKEEITNFDYILYLCEINSLETYLCAMHELGHTFSSKIYFLNKRKLTFYNHCRKNNIISNLILKEESNAWKYTKKLITNWGQEHQEIYLHLFRDGYLKYSRREINPFYYLNY